MRKIFSSPVSLFLALAILTSSCASQRAKNNDETLPEVMGPVIGDESVEEQPVPEESYGPQIPTGEVPVTADSTSTATSTETITEANSETATSTSTSTATSTATASSPAGAKLCVVLGPGMAKAMASAAVLASMKKAKIPIHCVVGTEMGAVVGALYAFSNGSTNNLQWQLFKLHKETYFNFPMLSLRDPRSTGKKLHEFFRDVFKDKRIEDLPIPFATVAVDEERSSGAELDRGDLADALSASVAVAGIFDPWTIQAEAFRSAALSDPAPVELAKKLGGNFIVVVDVLSEAGESAAKSRFQKAFTPVRSLMKLQRKEASFVVQVNAASIAFDEFGRQGEILAAGSAAAEKALPDLKAAWENFSAGSR